MATGNLCTVIPLCGWDPLGPAVGFALFHNSPREGEGVLPPGLIGAGYGWSTSYSGSVVATEDGAAVFEDDGSINFFTLINGEYVAPPGVHDRLQWNAAVSQWILTRVSQSRRIYNSWGVLTHVVDSAGNAVVIDRSNPGVWYIYDSSGADGAHLTLTISCGRVTRVIDARGRSFGLNYNGSESTNHTVLTRITFDCALCDVADPCFGACACSTGGGGGGGYRTPLTQISFRYDDSDRIDRIIDRDGSSVLYTYDGGDRIYRARTVSSSPGDPVYSEYYTYCNETASGGGKLSPCGAQPDLGQANGWTWGFYTDRRGQQWKWVFDPDGLVRASVDPLGFNQFFAFDADRNLTAYTNQLGRTWTYEYGPVGNLESVTTPLNHTTTYSWAPATADPNSNFYRLVQVTDASGHWVAMQYQSSVDPTAVTSIIEMPDGQGNPDAVTTLSYYDALTPGS